MSLISFEIDPLKVLGVTADASLEQIRDAYRQKAKRLSPGRRRRRVGVPHPQPGLRVTLLGPGRPRRPFRIPRPPVRPGRAPARPVASPTPRRSMRVSTIRTSIPAHIVAVEHLCVRYLWDDASYLWLGQAVPDEQRFLSCSLNLSWPDASGPIAADPIAERPAILAALGEIFDTMIISTRVVNSRSSIEDDRFSGWLSYSSFDRSSKALQTLHHALRARGLGLRQWSRDLFLPRAWQFDRKEA